MRHHSLVLAVAVPYSAPVLHYVAGQSPCRVPTASTAESTCWNPNTVEAGHPTRQVATVFIRQYRSPGPIKSCTVTSSDRTLRPVVVVSYFSERRWGLSDGAACATVVISICAASSERESLQAQDDLYALLQRSGNSSEGMRRGGLSRGVLLTCSNKISSKQPDMTRIQRYEYFA